MFAGRLHQYVSVQQRSTAQDAFGGQSTVWTEVRKVYAHVEPVSGREALFGQAIQSEITDVVTVRYDPALWAEPSKATSYRLVVGSRILNVRGFANIDGGDREVELRCTEGINDG